MEASSYGSIGSSYTDFLDPHAALLSMCTDPQHYFFW